MTTRKIEKSGSLKSIISAFIHLSLTIKKNQLSNLTIFILIFQTFSSNIQTWKPLLKKNQSSAIKSNKPSISSLEKRKLKLQPRKFNTLSNTWWGVGFYTWRWLFASRRRRSGAHFWAARHSLNLDAAPDAPLDGKNDLVSNFMSARNENRWEIVRRGHGRSVRFYDRMFDVWCDR